MLFCYALSYLVLFRNKKGEKENRRKKGEKENKREKKKKIIEKSQFFFNLGVGG